MKAVALTLAWLALGAIPAFAQVPRAQVPQPILQAPEAVRVVVLGDSLSAGFELPQSASLPARLQTLLTQQGQNVEIINAGVSGDTASDGLARLDWSVPENADAVIVELGANDALRGIDPKITRAALDEILARLTKRGGKILIAGMIAPLNLGANYGAAFNPIFADLAARYGAILYPFILEGVTGESALQLRDRMHPNAEGTKRMAELMLPFVQQLIVKIRLKP